MTSQEDYDKLGNDLLRKTPARTGVFLLSILAEEFPPFSTYHSLSDYLVSEEDTEISEEVPHTINWLRNKDLLPVTSGQGQENYRKLFSKAIKRKTHLGRAFRAKQRVDY